NDADITASVAERFEFGFGTRRPNGKFGLEQAHGERSAGRDETSHVVAKACASTAQTEREQFRKIDREPGEESELAEAHDRNQNKNVPRLAEKLEDRNRAQECRDKRHGENWFSAIVMSELRKNDHAE